MATLIFSNENFLPIVYNLLPVLCFGDQQIEITIPSAAPNGLATILWYEWYDASLVNIMLICGDTGSALVLAFRVVPKLLSVAGPATPKPLSPLRLALLNVSFP